MDAWSPIAGFASIGRKGAAGFSVGSRGYIGTGFSNSTTYKDLWEYNPLDNSWTQRLSLGGNPRWVGVGFTVGNKGYMGTGFYGFVGSQNDIWEYTPIPDLDVADIAKNNRLTIYPNPIISTASIHTDKALHNATITVCSVTGKQVKQMQNVSGQDITIQREGLPAGVYTMSINEAGKNVATGKLVVAD